MLADGRYAWPVQDPLTELATVPAAPFHPAVLAARVRLADAVADLLTLTDASLDRMWQWRPGDPGKVELRFGVYQIGERLEEAIRAIELGRAGGPGATLGPAIPALSVATAARWEIHGLLVPLAADQWDADPGNQDWSVRQIVGHVVSTQRLYGWSNAWFLKRPTSAADASYPPAGVLPPEPTQEAEGAGDPETVRARFDDVLDTNICANAMLDASAMHVGARLAGLPVTIGFRLGRYGSHMREHTIQLDKTLATLGYQPTEVQRVVRLIHTIYGRLEALIIGRPPDVLAERFASAADATSILTVAMADIVETAGRVRAAAEKA
jgi:hypothetical protein